MLADEVEQGQIVIDNRVDEKICDESGAVVSLIKPLVPETRGRVDSANRAAVYRDQIVLAQKDIEFTQLEPVVRPRQLRFVKNDKIVAWKFFNFRPLVLVPAVFN